MRNLTPADVSAGLPASAAAAALLGKAGASILLVLLFLAVTSASSAELIAVSSILTYDVYKVTLLILWMGALLMKDSIEIHESARDGSAGAQGLARDGGPIDRISYSLSYLNDMKKVAFFAVCMGVAGMIFFYIGISMGWLYVGCL
jgi:hypothetical protein